MPQRRLHSFKSGDENKAYSSPSRKSAMIHRRDGSCQKTFGSRLLPAMWPSTGFFAYLVHVRPRSFEYATDWVKGLALDSALVPPAEV
jgi:hypothetical protein